MVAKFIIKGHPEADSEDKRKIIYQLTYLLTN